MAAGNLGEEHPRQRGGGCKDLEEGEREAYSRNRLRSPVAGSCGQGARVCLCWSFIQTLLSQQALRCPWVSASLSSSSPLVPSCVLQDILSLKYTPLEWHFPFNIRFSETIEYSQSSMVSFIHDRVSVHALLFRALSKIIRDFSLSNPRTFPPPSSFLIFCHILENPSFQIVSSFVSMKTHFSQIPLTLKTLLWLFHLQTLQHSSFFTVVCFPPVSLSWTGPLCGWSPQLSTRVLPSLMITHKRSFHSKWTAQLGEVEALQSQKVHNGTYLLPPQTRRLPLSQFIKGWVILHKSNQCHLWDDSQTCPL